MWPTCGLMSAVNLKIFPFKNPDINNLLCCWLMFCFLFSGSSFELLWSIWRCGLVIVVWCPYFPQLKSWTHHHCPARGHWQVSVIHREMCYFDILSFINPFCNTSPVSTSEAPWPDPALSVLIKFSFPFEFPMLSQTLVDLTSTADNFLLWQIDALFDLLGESHK